MRIPDPECFPLEVSRGNGFLHVTARETRSSIVRKLEIELKTNGTKITCVSMASGSLFYSQYGPRRVQSSGGSLRAAACVPPPQAAHCIAGLLTCRCGPCGMQVP